MHDLLQAAAADATPAAAFTPPLHRHKRVVVFAQLRARVRARGGARRNSCARIIAAIGSTPPGHHRRQQQRWHSQRPLTWSLCTPNKFEPWGDIATPARRLWPLAPTHLYAPLLYDMLLLLLLLLLLLQCCCSAAAAAAAAAAALKPLARDGGRLYWRTLQMFTVEI